MTVSPRGDTRKLVLVVIDAMAPAMLEQAISQGEAPALARLMEDGTWIPECVAPFPSVTPVCAATITTGAGPDAHGIPAMNWYHRDERRYVEYGSSFTASRRFGFVRSLTDTVYRMNAEHLSADLRTVFEALDDQDVRTAGTTYLIYRGRHPHEASDEAALARLVGSTPAFGHAVMGPRELFYADLYASRRTGCRSQLGMPGVRDQHTGCVGAYLAEHDLYDFMLFSLPDNDAFSHRNGPAAQVTSIAAADEQLTRLMEAGGGPERFLADNAVIVCSDHAQVTIQERIPILDAFAGFSVALPRRLRDNLRDSVRDFDGAAARDWEGTLSRWRELPRASDGELAISPSMRSAQVYILDASRREELLAASRDVLTGLEGVDLVMWREPGPVGGDDARADDPAASTAVIRDGRGRELRFSPGAATRDPRGGRWTLRGDPAVIGAREEDGCLFSPDYPDALARVWSALHCANAGDLLASARDGYEFVDWGGQAHVGGGSHGSLHRADSLASLLIHGIDVSADGPAPGVRGWALADLTPLICDYFEGANRPDARD